MQPSSIKYAAFISYAENDDEYSNFWITHFIKELKRILNSSPELRRTRTKYGHTTPLEVYDYKSDSAAPSGKYKNVLSTAIASSSSMILVVHGNYSQSKDCLWELEKFKEIFGDQGYEGRLYIVALSESWLNELKKIGCERGILSNEDQIYIECYQEQNTDQPIPVYTDSRHCIRDDSFDRTIKRIGKSLEPYILQSVLPSQDGGSTSSPQEIRIYIEGSLNDESPTSGWQPLANKIKHIWDDILTTSQNNQRFNLTCRSFFLNTLPPKGTPSLTDADGVILFWNTDEAALYSQIDTLEAGLPRRHLTPAIVAYITPPKPPQTQRVLSPRWNVLRFENHLAHNELDVAKDDSPYLENFLKDILIKKMNPPKSPSITA